MRNNSALHAQSGDAGVFFLQSKRPSQQLLRPNRSIILGLIMLGVLVLAACGGISESSKDGVSQDNPTSTLFPTSSETPQTQTTNGRSPKVSLDPALDFPISLYQGEELLGAKELNFSDLFQGDPVILNFWAGLCPPCRAEMPDFQRFYEEFGDRVILLGLDAGPFTGLGSNRNGRELIEELGISYPAGSTTNQNVVREYKVLGMPSTIFMTRDGKIFRNWGGTLNEAKLAEITEKILALP